MLIEIEWYLPVFVWNIITCEIMIKQSMIPYEMVTAV